MTVYTELKTKSSQRFLTFKVDASGTRVVADLLGPSTATFDDFKNALPDNDCRYAVYDFDYVNADNCQFKKICFIMWSPDNRRAPRRRTARRRSFADASFRANASPIKNKMMYASTKDFFKQLLPGIAIELQATEKSEVDHADLRTRIQATITRK